MSQHELLPIVRLVDRPTRSKGFICVRLNAAGKAIQPSALHDALRLLPLSGKTHLYEIKTDEWLEVYDSRQLLKTFLTNEETNINFRVRLIARSKNAEKIAENLHDRYRSPADIVFDTISAAIKSQVEKKLSNGPEPVGEHILTYRDEWQNSIADKIEDLLGLEAQFIFEGSQVPRTRKIRVESIAARFKDAPHRDYPITVSATFDPTGDRALDTFPQTQNKQTTFLRDVVLEAAVNQVSLYDYWYDRKKVEDVIRQRLDHASRHFAYRSALIVVEVPPAPVPASQQIAAVIPWVGHRNRKIDFHIDTLMQMDAGGGGLYDALGRPDRMSWLAGTGNSVLKAAMHGRDFFDLTLPEQRTLEEKIRDALGREAARIGHRVELIVAQVMLAENRWLDKQVIEIESTDYPMKNELVPARFSISIAIKFGNIRRLINYVDQQQDDVAIENYNERIESSLKMLVGNTAGIVMKETETTDYFAAWEKWDVPFEEDDHVVAGHRNYVRNQLVHAIKTDLAQRFAPEFCEIRLHRDNKLLTEMIAQIKALELITITGEVAPEGSENDADIVPYEIIIHPGIVRADKWAEVLRRDVQHLKRENIEQGLKSSAEEFLKGRTTEELEELNYGLRASPRANATKADLQVHLNDHMVRFYGLTIDVEKVTTRSSLSHKVIRKVGALPHLAAYERAKRIEGEIAASGRVTEISVEFEADIIGRLQDSLRDNPKISDDDIARYNRERRELEQERERLRSRETGTYIQIEGPRRPSVESTASANDLPPDADTPDRL